MNISVDEFSEFTGWSGYKVTETKHSDKCVFCGRVVIVRTTSAGVFLGEIVQRSGTEVLLKNARRLWRWAGAASLSQLAVDGTSDPDNCKFPCEISEVLLTEAIEIIPATEKAIESIGGVPVWSV